MDRRDVGELLGAEEYGVLVPEEALAGAVARVGDDPRAAQGGVEELRRDLSGLRPPDLLRQPALGAVGPAEPVVELLRGRREVRPGLLAAVDGVLAEGVEEGGPLLEEGGHGLGGADGLVLRGEERGQEPAGVLGEAEDEEHRVRLREAGLGVVGGGEEGVDPAEEGGADREGRLLDAGGVEAEERREEDVEEDRAGGRVRRRDLGGGAGHRQAALQAVREEAGVPPLADEAAAEDRAQVRDGRELRRVAPVEDQAAQGEAQVESTAGGGRGQEVRVDLGLGVVVVGERGVEPGDVAVQLGAAGDELGGRCGRELGGWVSCGIPLGGSPAPAVCIYSTSNEINERNGNVRS